MLDIQLAPSFSLRSFPDWRLVGCELNGTSWIEGWCVVESQAGRFKEDKEEDTEEDRKDCMRALFFISGYAGIVAGSQMCLQTNVYVCTDLSG